MEEQIIETNREDNIFSVDENKHNPEQENIVNNEHEQSQSEHQNKTDVQDDIITDIADDDNEMKIDEAYFDIEELDKIDECVIHSPYKNIIPSHPSRVLFSGSSNSGKTNLMISLLTNKKFGLKYFYNVIFLFSPTCGNDPIYRNIIGDIIPVDNIFTEPNEEILNSIIDTQQNIITKIGRKNAPSTLIIFDDCISDDIIKSPSFKTLFFKGRHLGISVWSCLQYFMSLSKSLRQNITNFFILKPMRSELKAIIDDLCPSNLSLKEFEDVINLCTTPRYKGEYPFMHYDRTKPNNECFRRNLTTLIRIN